jgi:hypothetical protein
MLSFLGKAAIMAQLMFTTICRQVQLESEFSRSNCAITVGIWFTICNKKCSIQ